MSRAALCWPRRRWQQCYVDEHYMPTLLAAMGKDAETDCVGHLVRSVSRLRTIQGPSHDCRP